LIATKQTVSANGDNQQQKFNVFLRSLICTNRMLLVGNANEPDWQGDCTKKKQKTKTKTKTKKNHQQSQ
jgi:hypothetical protein